MSETYGYRLDDCRPHGKRLVDIFDIQNEFKDYTQLVSNILFQPLRQDSFPLVFMTVVGLQGIGKTQFCKYLAYLADTFYQGNVKIIFTDSIEVAAKEFDANVTYFVVIDDAYEHQSSRESMKKENILAAKKWFRLRHIAMETSGSKTGRIICIFNYQIWNTVDKNFKNPNVLTVLSPMADTKDIKDLKDKIGPMAYECLEDKQQKVDDGDEAEKGKAIVRIMSKPVGNGVGWFYGKYVPKIAPEWDRWPEYKRKDKYDFAGKKTDQDIIDELQTEEKWKDKIEIFVAFTRTDEKKEEQYDIAERVGISQPRVSQIVQEVRAEISKRMAS